MNDDLRCAEADELAAAHALGALEPHEARDIEAHLASCDQPHAELRGMLGAGPALAMSLEPVAPSAELRDRLMATVERTAQEHRRQVGPRTGAPARRIWLDWLSPGVARPLAAAALVGLLAVGALNVGLQLELARRDQALRSVAAAIGGGGVAFRVDGAAGRGYVVDTPGTGAALVVADVTSLPADRLYELWLIDASGTPVAVGTFVPSDRALAVVAVEHDLTGFATFAVTVEQHRVAAPTGTPVMVGDLKAG